MDLGGLFEDSWEQIRAAGWCTTPPHPVLGLRDLSALTWEPNCGVWGFLEGVGCEGAQPASNLITGFPEPAKSHHWLRLLDLPFVLMAFQLLRYVCFVLFHFFPPELCEIYSCQKDLWSKSDLFHCNCWHRIHIAQLLCKHNLKMHFNTISITHRSRMWFHRQNWIVYITAKGKVGHYICISCLLFLSFLFLSSFSFSSSLSFSPFPFPWMYTLAMKNYIIKSMGGKIEQSKTDPDPNAKVINFYYLLICKKCSEMLNLTCVEHLAF